MAAMEAAAMWILIAADTCAQAREAVQAAQAAVHRARELRAETMVRRAWASSGPSSAPAAASARPRSGVR